MSEQNFNEIDYIQQGDVRFHKMDGMPDPKTMKVKKQPRAGLITFAEGEVTGHHHSCDDAGAVMYETDAGDVWLEVKEGHEKKVEHQEHGTVTLGPGFYKMGAILEYDHMLDEARQVYD